MLLYVLTGRRQPAILAKLRDEARQVLLQMARKHDGFTAYALLARISGMPEERIGQAWEQSRLFRSNEPRLDRQVYRAPRE
jgi:hypothetical protein